MRILKTPSGSFLLEIEEADKHGDSKFPDMLDLPEYPCDKTDASGAIVLSMIDIISIDSRGHLDRVNIIKKATKTDNNVKMCLALMPYYCQYYADQLNMDYADLAIDTNEAIADAIIGGMIK